MKIYLSNKMTGIPFFNAPWFDNAARHLEMLPHVTEVFNPAQHDRELGLDPMLCPTGSAAEARAQNFQPLATTLLEDLNWIGYHGDVVVVGPDWRGSRGALVEVAFAQALYKPAYEYMHYLTVWDDPDLLNEAVLPPLLEIHGSVRT